MFVLVAAVVLMAEPFAVVEHAACFGACPVYKVSVFDDGHVLYEGKDFVRVVGRAGILLQPPDVAAVRAAFEEAGFSGLPERLECQTVATDFPTTTLTFRSGQKSKTLRHYHGCFGARENGWLSTLEGRFEQIVQTKRWVGEPRPIDAAAPTGRRWELGRELPCADAPDAGTPAHRD